MSSRPLTTEEIVSTSQLVDRYAEWRQLHKFPQSTFRKMYSEGAPQVSTCVRKLIPKEHIILYHFVPFIQRWGTMGMLSEQALEGQHAEFNELHKRYSSMVDPRAQSTVILQQHLLSHHPAMQSITPTPRTCPDCSCPISKTFVDHCVCRPRTRQKHEHVHDC